MPAGQMSWLHIALRYVLVTIHFPKETSSFMGSSIVQSKRWSTKLALIIKKKMHTSIVQMAMITGQYWSKDAWWRDEAIRSAERLAIQLQAGQKMTQYVLLLIFAARSNPTFCKVKQRASNSSNANTPLLETRDLYFSL